MKFPRSIPFAKRLTALRDIDAATGCWNWTGSLDPDGYGKTHLPRPDNSHIGVHCLSYATFRGSVGDGLSVLHSCDNRRCFNPAHLFLGSQRDNVQDMVRKGRANFFGLIPGQPPHKRALARKSHEQ